MDDKQDKEPLLYDPKVERRRPQRSSSPCYSFLRCLFKCGCCLSIVIGLVSSFATAWFFLNWAQTLFQQATQPHLAHAFNASHSNGTLPVIPLINHDSLFDIGVSVWLRPTEQEAQAHRASLALDALAVADASESAGDALERWEWTTGSRALFSDIVFRGVHMTHKHLFETVHFELPTARFCAVNITSDDLRASFFIVPHAGGLVEQAKGWSSAVKEGMVQVPVRSGSTSIQDAIFDAAAVSFPLVRLISSAPPEPTPALNETVSSNTTLKLDTATINVVASSQAFAPTGQDPSKLHPYISTRTQIRLIDSVALYSREAFDKRHDELKATACEQPSKHLNQPRSSLAHRECALGWYEAGPFGVRVELDGAEGERVAYAPSLLVNPKSEGVLDQLPAPVNRSQILQAEDGTYTPLGSYDECQAGTDSITVSWQLSFAGRTPAKAWLADTLSTYLPLSTPFNASDYARAQSQDSHALRSGLVGHPHSAGAHPRRRLALWWAGKLLTIVLWFGSAHYWLTRPSTVGLARRWAMLSAAADGALPLLMTFMGIFVGSIYVLLATYVSIALIDLPSWLKAKLVFRLEFDWRTAQGGKRLIPRLVQRAPSHAERHSDREEVALPRAPLFALGIALCALYAFYSDEDSIPFFSSTMPKKSLEDYNVGMNPRNSLLLRATLSPLNLTPYVAQLALNAKRGSRAGVARWVAIGRALRAALAIAERVGWVIGDVRHSEGVNVDLAVQCLLCAVDAAQSLWMRDAVDVEREEEGEEAEGDSKR